MRFLPVTSAELNQDPDFVLVTGDAYVDHPSFGAAVIGRLLEDGGFRVGILAQPDWKDCQAFTRFGRPRLGFLVTGGNIDSMVNHYTVAKKRRKKDFYSPGGTSGLRPDRASIVYANKIREVYRDVPIVLGGLEASLRRLAHYDYWDDRVRRSVLLDANADLLVYGMGEHPIMEIAHALASGLAVEEITFVRGTVFKTKDLARVQPYTMLPSFESIVADKTKYAESFLLQHQNTDCVTGNNLVEHYAAQNTFVVQNAPAEPLSAREFDHVCELPYTRKPHPMYDDKGGVPAIQEVEFSLISSRGCFGGCHFCALNFHQGRLIQSRSHDSILREAKLLIQNPNFKGYIHDVGGPTANFRRPACQKQSRHGVCKDRTCLGHHPCSALEVSHSDYLSLLRKLRALPGIKKVFVRSGIRFDYVLLDRDESFLRELIRHHISGQLKVAPEHVSNAVLEKMGKPSRSVYERFRERFARLNQRFGMEQYLVPYFMSSHPGADLRAAVELAEFLRDMGHMPEQVQDFYPTPGTLSTCMYYTGLDPRDMSPVYIPKNPHEKAMQRALMQYRLPQNHALVEEALRKTGRLDLIGFGKKCLIRPNNANQRMSTTGLTKRKSGKQSDTGTRAGRHKKTRSNAVGAAGQKNKKPDTTRHSGRGSGRQTGRKEKGR